MRKIKCLFQRRQRITKWVKISLEPKDLLDIETVRGYLLWRLYGIKRFLEDPVKWLRRQQKLRRTNRYLLEMAKQKMPMYDPPSTDEVKDFIHQSKNRKINHGD
jgi:hypothetical protein